MKHLKHLAAILLIAVTLGLCLQITSTSRETQALKYDAAELNHIKYGLFSIDTWKGQISEIIASEIDKLYLTDNNERELRQHVEVQLHTFIDNVYKKVEQTNKGSTSGWIRQRFINNFMDKETVKKGIPTYAAGIVKEMTRTKNEVKFKELVKAKVEAYFEKTFDNQDRSVVNGIIAAHGAKDQDDAINILKLRIADLKQQMNYEAITMITFALILFLFIYFLRGEMTVFEYTMVVLSLVCLLVAGVTMPMIDMEARIDNMSFMLMGHPMAFQNQVLYFQSKSIFDVFMVMITHPEVQMKAVGLLVIGFSVFFPLLKLVLSIVYFTDYKGARMNRIVQFFVLKSGKWSMADVMVVAIFMAYIGFNGIINSQFSKFVSKDQEIMVLATNGTALQAGYYLFLAYTVLALFLPGFLERGAVAKPVVKEPVEGASEFPDERAIPIT